MGAPLVEPLSALAAARDDAALYFNATAVSFEGRGVLFVGPPGHGKSATALGLMAFGAHLISDDGVWFRAGRLTPPEAAPPLIEARQIGLLNAGPTCASAPLDLIVDLSCAEDHRLPPRRCVAIHDEKVPLIRANVGPTLIPALLQFLRHGRAEL